MSEVVIGFNGMPVAGATGIRALLVNLGDGWFARAAYGKLGNRWAESDIDRFDESGLLTRLPSRLPYEDPSMFAVYAHRDFVTPSSGTLEDEVHLRLSIIELTEAFTYESGIDSYVAFMPFEQAETLLKGWAKRLLESAYNALTSPNLAAQIRGQVAVMEAMRARFPLAGFDDAETTADRRNMFTLAWAGAFYQGNTLAIEFDADLEFPPGEIRLAGSKLIPNLSTPEPARPRGFVDAQGTAVRRWEDAA